MNKTGGQGKRKSFVYKVYNLIAQKVSPRDQNLGDGVIKWGDNDRYPLDLINAIYDSDTARSLYETYSRFIIGSGFSIEELNDLPANKQDSLLKVASLAADQLAMLKACAFHVITNEVGETISFTVLPVEGMRMCIPDDRNSNVITHVKYNPYWGDARRRTLRDDITYPLWDNDLIKRQAIIKEHREKHKATQFPGFVYYYFEGKPLNYFYPKPLSLNNMNLLKVDARITQFHESNLAKNMFISAVLNIPGNGSDKVPVKWDETGKPSEYKTRAELLDEQLSDIATGSENAGSLLVNWTRDSAGNAATFSSPANIANDQLFLNLETSVVDKIARVVRVPPILANIQVAGRLGATQEIKNAMHLLNEQTKKERMSLSMALSHILPAKITASLPPEGIDFKPLNITTDMADKHFEALLPNEKREYISKTYDIELEELPTPALPATNPDTSPVAMEVNEHLKSLTGRQFQNYERIIRKFYSGKISEAEARTMLKSGFGFTDEQLNEILVPVEQLEEEQ